MGDQDKQARLTGFEKYRMRKKGVKKEKLYDVGKWVAEGDRRLSEELSEVARKISESGKIRLIRLIGPTCSGKTTAARLLSDRFSAIGKRLHIISIDDFYYNTDYLRRLSKEKGSEEIDYDSPDTVDLAELKRFVTEIFTSDKSHCPIFDFTKGKRDGYKEYLCDDDDVFLFEGIQALYPEISRIFFEVGHPTADIYIAPQSAISIGGEIFRPNEIRLMRRIVRDKNFRSTEADFTFLLWKGVRDNEEKNIFPYVKNCEYSIDSTLPYEIGVLKPYLIKALAMVNKDDPNRVTAERLLRKMKNVPSIDSRYISEDSLYKEFV